MTLIACAGPQRRARHEAPVRRRLAVLRPTTDRSARTRAARHVHKLPHITPQQHCLAYAQHVLSFQPLFDQTRHAPKGGFACTDSGGFACTDPRLCCHTQGADNCWQAQQPPLQPPLQAKQLQPQQLPPQQQVSFAPDAVACHMQSQQQVAIGTRQDVLCIASSL